MFLADLKSRLDEVRGTIFRKYLLPIIQETFSEVRKKEAKQSVMMGKSPSVAETNLYSCY